ncbi:uncharacterized protein LOC122877719 [Siniperca chuatsi]|uniref:uncharacterized protein LOC122877719 n=1 Tax=Siniperca chuatsi TaxID=119488 RepID=UPI001CE0B59C|nr:uncharacterized protein LOC122877719 [Siniperca chuatsi]
MENIVIENMTFGRGRGFESFAPTPAVGKGRGVLSFSPDASTPKSLYDGLAQAGCGFNSPQCDVTSGVHGKEGVNEKLLTDIASQIGVSIGESIATCIEHRLGNAMGSSVVGTSANDSSMLNVIVRQDVREPVSFKGDGTDTCSVREWEVMMLSYMKKSCIPVSEQAEEVILKLVGRAREVVKVGIRSKPVLTLTDGPEPIFEILKQHFSDTVTSSLPLADFYATLPHSGEHPFDYWLRLNKALEVTEDSLKRQNKTFDCLSRDLAAMFIQNCPDPELSLILRCKPMHQWTVADIHEKLVERAKDLRQTPKQKVNTVLFSQHREVAAPLHSVSPVTANVAAVAPPNVQPAECAPDRLDKVIALLERVLAQQEQQPRLFSKYNARTQNPKVRAGLPCAVCGDAGHTTVHHCRSDHLCFSCYAPDHTRAECPVATVKPRATTQTAQQQEN